MQIHRMPGLTAGTLYQKATTAPSQVEKCLLTGEAILCAFIEGALNPMRPSVPQLLAGAQEFTAAFRNGQREQKNEGASDFLVDSSARKPHPDKMSFGFFGGRDALRASCATSPDIVERRHCARYDDLAFWCIEHLAR